MLARSLFRCGSGRSRVSSRPRAAGTGPSADALSPDDEGDREREPRAHRDAEDPQSATTVKDVLDSGSERQPQDQGCSRTRLPSPSGTTNIMTPMLVVTPSRQGRPLRTPACAPAAVSMMLLGPGVTAATTAKRRTATICSVVICYPPWIGRPPGASPEDASDAS